MRTPKIIPALYLAVLLLLGAAVMPAQIPDAQVEKRVNDLIQQMTLEEKIGQMAELSGAPWGGDGMKVEEHLRRGHTGSILWLADPAQINRLQKIAVEQSRLHIPVLFALDVIHGYKTVFPVPLGMAASWDPALVEREQSIAARESAATGIMWTFTPMVDIARDPRWGRIVEGAGEDPYLGAAMAAAQVRGFQGKYIGEPGHILACAKHFGGYGGADGGRDYDSSYLPDVSLWNVYFPPFHAAVKAGVGTFMSAYMDLNDVPATGNRFLLHDVLRDAWGFQGFVVSDAMSVQGQVVHGYAHDARDATYRAISAGLDMDMASGLFLKNVAALVAEKKLTVAQIEEAVRPILAAKIRLGLFEHPYIDESKIPSIYATPEHRQAARLAVQRTAVLLRNENDLLPLDKSKLSSIAVIGPLADSQVDTDGGWLVFGMNSKDTVTVLQGIRNKVGAAVKVEYAKGVELRKKYLNMFDGASGAARKPEISPAQQDEMFQKAVETAKKADVVIAVMGETATMSGELGSQAALDLPGRQNELLKALVATGKPVALVLINGRPLNIEWPSENVRAILTAWHPGTEGGNGVADLLFGDANPGGKLPVSWQRNAGQVPVYYAHNLTHQPENSPGFKSRYWDMDSAPLYPFGYGLSYSKFTYSDLVVKQREAKVGDTVDVTVDVRNEASCAGDEVVQLYIHQRAGSASRPVRQLKGFQRISLAPGEKKTVAFRLGKDELRYWSGSERKWVLEPESFDVWVGGDSTAKLHGDFKLVP